MIETEMERKKKASQTSSSFHANDPLLAVNPGATRFKPQVSFLTLQNQSTKAKPDAEEVKSFPIPSSQTKDVEKPTPRGYQMVLFQKALQELT